MECPDGRRSWPESKCHVRAQAYLTVEDGSCEFQTLSVADKKQKISVRRNQLLHAVQAGRVIKMDGLRQLNDAAPWEGLQHRLAKALMMRPDVPEIAATVEEYRAIRHRAAKRVRGKIIHGANVIRCDAVPRSKPGDLPKIYRTVADVRMIRKINESNRANAFEFAIKRTIDLLP